MRGPEAERLCSSVAPICLYLFKSVPFGVLQGSLESVEGTCKVCGSHDEEEEEEEDVGCDQSVSANGSTSCSCPDNSKQGKV